MRTERAGFLYERIPDDLALSQLKDFKTLLDGFDSLFKGIFSGYSYSIPLIYEIFKRIDQRADYYLFFHSNPEQQMEMCQTKEVSLMAYWVLRYKPLSLPLHSTNKLFNAKNCTINEYFAAFCIAVCARELSPRTDILSYFSPKNIDMLVYSFMHRDISKEAMICYVESLLNVVGA